jgi:excisionase family DNA binding protein
MTAVPRLLTVEQVAEALQVTPRTVFKLICAKKLVAVKLGRRCTRIRATEYERFISSNETEEE